MRLVIYIMLCRLRLCERIRPGDRGVQTVGKTIPPSVEAEIQNRVEKRERAANFCVQIHYCLVALKHTISLLCVFRKWWWTENAIGIGATKMLK